MRLFYFALCLVSQALRLGAGIVGNFPDLFFDLSLYLVRLPTYLFFVHFVNLRQLDNLPCKPFQLIARARRSN